MEKAGKDHKGMRGKEVLERHSESEKMKQIKIT